MGLGQDPGTSGSPARKRGFMDVHPSKIDIFGGFDPPNVFLLGMFLGIYGFCHEKNLGLHGTLKEMFERNIQSGACS